MITSIEDKQPALVDLCRRFGVRKLELHVFPWNEAAIALYEAFRFTGFLDLTTASGSLRSGPRRRCAPGTRTRTGRSTGAASW